MPSFIERRYENDREVFYIANPTTQGENFAEKWNACQERAYAFFAWREKAMADLVNIAGTEGFDQIGKLLGALLGESETRRAMEKYASRKVSKPRATDTLRGDCRLGLGPVGVVVPRNTFFGK